MAELGGRVMIDTAIHSNLSMEAKRVGDAIAEEVGDTFINWRSLAPRYQWQRIVRMVIDAPLEARHALLDALDAVPPVCELCDHQHAPMVCVPCHNRTADRAERAERERDLLRDLVRAAGALISESHIICPEHLWEEYAHACADAGLDIEGEDLSADADADAEPVGCSGWHDPGAPYSDGCSGNADAEPSRAKCDRCGHDVEGHTPAGCWVGNCYCAAIRGKREPSRAEAPSRTKKIVEAIASGGYSLLEPSRAEGDCWACHYGAEDPERWQDRHTCGGQVPVDRTGLSRAFHPSDAEGGRPREADPQGPSIRTGGASVDGGGDDGCGRAIDYYEGVRQGLSFARDAVVGVMGMYPEDVFTEDGTTPDAIAARMARHVCQVILDGLVFDEGCESQGCVLPYKHEGGCEY